MSLVPLVPVMSAEEEEDFNLMEASGGTNHSRERHPMAMETPSPVAQHVATNNNNTNWALRMPAAFALAAANNSNHDTKKSHDNEASLSARSSHSGSGASRHRRAPPELSDSVAILYNALPTTGRNDRRGGVSVDGEGLAQLAQANAMAMMYQQQQQQQQQHLSRNDSLSSLTSHPRLGSAPLVHGLGADENERPVQGFRTGTVFAPTTRHHNDNDNEHQDRPGTGESQNSLFFTPRVGYVCRPSSATSCHPQQQGGGLRRRASSGRSFAPPSELQQLRRNSDGGVEMELSSLQQQQDLTTVVDHSNRVTPKNTTTTPKTSLPTPDTQPPVSPLAAPHPRQRSNTTTNVVTSTITQNTTTTPSQQVTHRPLSSSSFRVVNTRLVAPLPSPVAAQQQGQQQKPLDEK